MSNKVDAGRFERCVLVHWLDSCAGDRGWQALDDYEGGKPLHCHTAGWVIADNDEAIAIAQTVCLGEKTEDAPPQYTGAITIPKVCIVSLKELGTGRKTG